MALQPGTRLGAYEVLALLGSGGMGEVYRARDTRLERTVAIKVLRDSHSDLQARFAREAKAIASLAHPHICTLFDIGHEQGTDYLVMELLDGETLAARLARGPLPIGQALHEAVQIASALGTAHRAGFVHRDLKPANVMLVKGGAKLLDFGLAKYASGSAAPSATSATLAEAPDRGLATITTPGMILGTVQYMAPEQLEGRNADARTDLFAFGAVLYEMLVGAKAFAGETQASVIAAILDHEPIPLSTRRPSIPPALDRVVQKCLAKAPDDRWQTASDLASELRWIEEAGLAPATASRRNGLHATAFIAAAVVAALVTGAIAFSLYFRRAPADAPEIRLQMATPGGNLTKFAVSPDGRNVVFEAGMGGKTQLWLRPLDAESAHPLTGTENGTNPFWSPDSRSIAFFADAQLKRIELAGGPPLVLTSVTGGALGGTWSRDGSILFVPRNTGPVYRIPARGGKPVAASRVDPPRITAQWHPFALPDGRHFLFLGLGKPDERGVYVGSLDSNDAHRLFDADAEAVFAPPDLVLHPRQGALLAQRLDLKTWQPVGDPLPVAPAVATDFQACGCAAISSSDAGPIAYRAAGPQREFVWVDRSGNDVEKVGAPDVAQFGIGRPSPDDRTVAITRMLGAYQDVWLIETASGILRRLTFDAANKVGPLWSPDGRRVVFAWDPQGVLDLYEKSVDGTGNPRLLLSSAESKTALDWSPDGRFILYSGQNLETGADVSALPLVGDKKPIDVAHTAFNEGSGRFSPDGRWVAYQSNETGQNEIYVQPFPGPGSKKQITSGGGTFPLWSPRGRELFYLAGNRLMAVPLEWTTSKLDAGKAKVMFTPTGVISAVSGDGQRFLLRRNASEASPITILLNWKPR